MPQRLITAWRVELEGLRVDFDDGVCDLLPDAPEMGTVHPNTDGGTS